MCSKTRTTHYNNRYETNSDSYEELYKKRKVYLYN